MEKQISQEAAREKNAEETRRHETLAISKEHGRKNPPTWVDVDKETAYGVTMRFSRAVRVY